MTKHDRIMRYIKNLKVGSKFSVRQLAQELNVSEGTAYRAIKDAQLLGLVCTVPRIGTLRIEDKNNGAIEKITFAEVLNIVDGSVVGGKSGLHKPLSKFLIGAMEVKDMDKYLQPESLLIVGNRRDAQIKALRAGAAVLVTGGFEVDNTVIELADKLKMPVISSSYDTFTVATLINKAIYKRLVKKEIVKVKDAMVTNPQFLNVDSTVGDWRKLLKETRHSRFPVVDHENRVVGIATTNDIAEHNDDTPIKEVMSKNPIIVNPDTPLAHAAHLMSWEDVELIPVTENKKLIGVITRQDAIRVLQNLSFQPQVGETVDSLLMSRFAVKKLDNGVCLSGKTEPIMLNAFGVSSSGVLMTAMVNAGIEAFRSQKRIETIPDSFSVYFSKPVELEEKIEIRAEIIDIGRKSGKAEISLLHENSLVAKAILSVRVNDR